MISSKIVLLRNIEKGAVFAWPLLLPYLVEIPSFGYILSLIQRLAYFLGFYSRR